MHRWWHILTTIAGGAAVASTPTAQTAIGSHPIASTIAGVAWAVLGSIAPSPLAWFFEKRV
jgi:hypothetical protein